MDYQVKLKPYDPERGKYDPAGGYRPSTKKYDPNDPHFDPFHPRDGTPKELLEKEWGESSDDEREAGGSHDPA